MGRKKKKKSILWYLKRIFLGATATLFLTFISFYSGIKEIFNDIVDKTSKDLNYWVCEQDQNIRGVMLSNVRPENEEGKPLILKTGSNGLDGRGALILKYEKNRDLEDGTYCFDSGVVMVKNLCTLTYRISKEGRLLVSSEMYDHEKKLIGLISENKFLLNTDCQFTWNMDDTAFEVVGSDFKPVLSLEYIEPDTLSIQGIFYDDDKFVVLGRGLIGSVPIGDMSRMEYAKSRMEPIFEYFGKDWFGKRIKTSKGQ